MNATRLLIRALMGRRLPITHGTIRVSDLRKGVDIARDRWGIPYIRAENDAAAWYALGFCHGQDRTFQLELLMRLARGTLAAIVGAEALPIDRLARRIGFHRSAERQLPV